MSKSYGEFLMEMADRFFEDFVKEEEAKQEEVREEKVDDVMDDDFETCEDDVASSLIVMKDEVSLDFAHIYTPNFDMFPNMKYVTSVHLDFLEDLFGHETAIEIYENFECGLNVVIVNIKSFVEEAYDKEYYMKGMDDE